MIIRLIKKINFEINSVQSAAMLLIGFNILSLLTSLLREKAIAYKVGASETLDLFLASFSIPNILSIFVVSFVSTFVLIPIIEKKRKEHKDDINKIHKFIDSLFSFFCIFSAILVILAFFFTPFIIKYIFPLYSIDQQATIIFLSRLIYIEVFLMSLSGLFSTFVQLKKRFLIFALSPILYTLGGIIGIIFFFDIYGINGLAYGVILGAILHLSINFFAILHQDLIPKRLYIKGIFSEIKCLFPPYIMRVFVLFCYKIQFIVFVIIAATMTTGSIAILTFADNFKSIPITLLVIPLSVASFPFLSSLFAHKKMEEFFDLVFSSFNTVLIFVLPIISYFIITRFHIINFFLGGGKFQYDEILLVSTAMAILLIGTIGHIIFIFFLRIYFAMNKIIPPLLFSVSLSIITILLAVFFAHIFVESNILKSIIALFLGGELINGAELLVLPLAYSISYTIMSLTLIVYFFYKCKRWVNIKKNLCNYGSIFFISLLLTIVAYIILVLLEGIIVSSFLLLFITGLVVAVVWGLYVYKVDTETNRNLVVSMFGKIRIWKK